MAPHRWAHTFGVISMAAMVVLLVTGVFLTSFYDASGPHLRYDGSYTPLAGVEVSPAYASTMHLSFEVRGGLLARQAHHWAALVLPASLILQLFSTFFSGAFRKPRRGMWLLLFATFVLALAGGWSGYAMPDDMLSGTGLRIMHGMVLGVPVVGPRLAFLLFGGEFPGHIMETLYPLHVYVVPGLLVAVVALRLRLAFVRGPMRSAAGREHDSEGGRASTLRVTIARSGGLFLVAVGVLVLMGGAMTVSPIWLYGPANPAVASNGSQPDWYLGFLDGALRLVPPGWEVVLGGNTWSLGLLVPMAVIGGFLVLVAAYPFIESRLSGDHEEHHVLDRPRDHPVRTGAGAAGAVFYGVLLSSAGVDIMATQLHLAFESLIYALRVALVLGPALAFVVTRAVCLGLQERERTAAALGFETGVIVRAADGGYTELHGPLPASSTRPADQPLDTVPTSQDSAA
ncbi:cytochrome b [Nocardioides lijunqiniae]|uniref:cytochrome b n=1 Tax=Nocardioides lijunqiniae TaxID=2760832 RepID=UPI0030B8684A